MSRFLSRRTISGYFADELLKNTSIEVLAKQLAAYLIDKRRTKEQHLIIKDIQQQLADRGYVLGSVTSAYQLNEATLLQLNDFIKSQTNAKKVELDSTIDKSVIGGVKIDLPSKVLDLTIAHRLTQLKTRFNKA